MANKSIRNSILWAANKISEAAGGRTSTPLPSPDKSNPKPKATSAQQRDLPTKDRPSAGHSANTLPTANEPSNSPRRGELPMSCSGDIIHRHNTESITGQTDQYPLNINTLTSHGAPTTEPQRRQAVGNPGIREPTTGWAAQDQMATPSYCQGAFDNPTSQPYGATGAIARTSTKGASRVNAYDCERIHGSNSALGIRQDPPTSKSSSARKAQESTMRYQTNTIDKSSSHPHGTAGATSHPPTTGASRGNLLGYEPSRESDYASDNRPEPVTSKSIASRKAQEILRRCNTGIELGPNPSHTMRRGLRSSLEDYADPESIQGKVAEIKNLIMKATALRYRPEAAAQGLELYEEIVEKNGKLSSYIVLNGVESTFRATCLEFTNQARELRLAFTEEVRRVRSNSVDDNQLSPQASSRPTFTFASDIADQIRENADESELMYSKSIPACHGFSSEEAIQTMIDQLTRRLATHEADHEDQNDMLSRSINLIQADHQKMNESIESVKHALPKMARELRESERSTVANINALRKRMECIESIPAAKELTALRTEVEQLKAQVIRIHQNSCSQVLGTQQIQDLKAAIKTEILASFSPITDPSIHAELNNMRADLDKTSFKSESLLYVTKNLYNKVKEIENYGPPPSAAGNTPATEATQRDNEQVLKSDPQAENITPAQAQIDQPEVEHVLNNTPQIDNTTFLRRKLDLTLAKLSRATATLPSMTDDLSMVDAVYATEKPNVIKLVSLANETMKELLRQKQISNETYSQFETTTETAESWLRDLENLRLQRPKVPIPQNIPNRKVPVFHGLAAVNVYEFLDIFNSTYAGVASASERADLLYRDFLSDAIRTQCISKSEDFSGLKTWLIDQFGDLSFILNQMIVALEGAKLPQANDVPARLSFFNAISRFFFRTEKLSRCEAIESSAVNTFMSSLTTMHRLIQILPDLDENDLINKFRAQGINTTQPHGQAALSTYKAFVHSRVEDLQRSKDKISNRPSQQPLRPKQKTVQIASSNPLEAESSSSVMAAAPQTQWWTNGLFVPCPIVGHDHEVSTCAEFFRLTPAKRREGSKVEARRMCWSCLRPRALCKGQCLNAKIPDILRCPGCAEQAKSKGLSPLCILFCTQSDHDSLKPSPKDVHAALKKYLKAMPPSVNPDTIVFANFGSWSLAANNTERPPQSSKTRPPAPHAQVKVFNTENGSLVTTEDPSEHTEWGDSCLILQTIKIGSSTCLVMFDRGANVNLINGDLAESEGLYVLSQQPTQVQGIGAQGVLSEYGRYIITLGSERGDYHRLTCHGMPQVTVKFPKYDLRTINEEVIQLPCVTSDCPLPEFVGGTQVDLLIGNQDHTLDPVRIGVLPCGLSVFKSPFYDIFGSNICFGGPHPLFEETNRANHFSSFKLAHFAREISSVQAQLLTNPSLYFPTPDVLESHSKSKCLAPPPKQSLEGVISCTEAPSLLCLSTCEGVNSPPPCVQRKEVNAPVPRYHFCDAYKAYIPLSKLREVTDEDDLSDTVAYRCPDCSECVTCKQSSRQSALSIQDAAEQLAIEKSVEVDTINHAVWVDLPFVVDPVPFLTKRHHGSDNYNQAWKVYLGQCRKPTLIKEAIKAQHADLVAQGFIQPLDSLPKDTQASILSAPFRHYLPFRSVIKEDSPSTPVRLVVDPTMTGLNLCLPKGENKIARIPDILLEARTQPHMWATDIRKMYNQLKLKKSSLQYQLMLFHNSMDPKVTPEVWVLTSAWYGVVNTGNQAGYAVEKLATLYKDKCPQALAPLKRRRYVDDIASAAATIALREQQIKECQWVLAQGGFSLKYIIRSHEPPPEGSTTDGQHVKLLGYKYNPITDEISPALVPKTIESIMPKGQLSRRIIASRVGEFYDPLGLFEPLKLLLKLHQTKLNGLSWDEALSEKQTIEWVAILNSLNEAAIATIPRSVVLPESSGSLRLLCLSDAAEAAGGAAVYVGRECASGSMSCSLLTAKSRLLDATVPRNELTAVMLMADLAFRTKRVLGEAVGEIIYVTDSSIALAWCLNTSLKLRLFVFNRVEAIRRLIRWTMDDDNIPLYHIAGDSNIADLLTKIQKDQTVDFNSIKGETPWQAGLPWMLNPTSKLPITEHQKLNIPQELAPKISEECYSEPFFSNPVQRTHPAITSVINTKVTWLNDSQYLAMSAGPAPAPGGRVPFFVDLIRLGWFKACKVVAVILQGTRRWRTRTTKTEWVPPWITEANKTKIQAQVETVIFRHETKMLKKTMPARKLAKFEEQDKILYYPGRLSMDNPFRFEDLDEVPFLDAPDVVGVTPVVAANSEIFFAYLMAVHLKIRPHVGNTTTLREIAKKMFVFPSPKQSVQQVRADCTKCRMIINKTIELEMAKHQFARTMIAPPFYNAMIDIAFGFPGQPYKNARKRLEIYALVMVCLLTGATNILALEGLETQDVVAALERHAARYGIPAHIFIDNGTQLKTLRRAEFSVRNLQLQASEAMGMKVSVSNAKSHEERGRVERKIKFLRSSLSSITEGRNLPVQTAIMWETLFAKISSTIDDLPIAKGNSSNRDAWGFEILTANRIKLGRNNNRSLEGAGIEVDLAPNMIKLLQRNRQIYQSWYQLFMDEIHNINLRPDKWTKSSPMPVVGDIVMFVMTDAKASKEARQWKLGRVHSVSKRTISIQYSTSSNKSQQTTKHTVERNPRDVSIIVALEDLYTNSKDYFNCLNDQSQS